MSMNSLAAVCDVHGAFPSRAFAMFNVQGLTLTGNTENCPRCGRPSKIVDGTFNVSADGVVKVLAAPEWTREALRDVQRAIQNMARHAGKDPDVQIRHLKEANPQAAELLTAATHGWTREQKMQLWSVLIAFLSAVLGTVSIYQNSTHKDLTPSEIAVIVNEAVKQAQEISLKSVPPDEVPSAPPSDTH
ncbi:hypothetical protein [Arthrobacter koreensis]|uniref:hypothetical protein n=1 Tax=Arthrobacter koreensis TaxID=199136 RepID=UPI003804B56B